MPTRSEEIEREIERTRAEMTRTAEEIERRLKPDHVIDSAMGWIQGNPRGRAVADEVMELVGRNPLPFALIGIGVAWLAYELTRGPRRARLNQYTPMRRRLGPDVPPSRHHTHVEDRGRAYPKGSSPNPDDLIGRVPSGERAEEAARAFADVGGTRGATGTGPASGTAPDADTIIGRHPSGERASDAARAFEGAEATGPGKTGPVHTYDKPGT